VVRMANGQYTYSSLRAGKCWCVAGDSLTGDGVLHRNIVFAFGSSCPSALLLLVTERSTLCSPPFINLVFHSFSPSVRDLRQIASTIVLLTHLRCLPCVVAMLLRVMYSMLQSE